MVQGCVEKKLLPQGSFQEKLPCPSQGENPIGRRGSQQKELGLKGYDVQLSYVLMEI